MSNIVVVGSCNMDLVVEANKRPKAGETLMGNKLIVTYGGKGANQAVAASRLGADVKMVACVGEDIYGTQILENLKQNNINTDYVYKVKNISTGTAHIILAEGDNSILVVKGANEFLDSEVVDKSISAILEADIVVIQHEIPMETIEYLVDICYKNDKEIILNPAPATKVKKQILDKITYITPNEYEAKELFSNDTKEEMLKKNANKLIITEGSKGATYFNGEKIITVSTKKAEVVDTTGAGDTFNGAFAVAISEGKSIEDALEFANKAASLSVRKLGAQGGMPTKKEVEELI